MHINIDDLINSNSSCCLERKVASENGKRFEINSSDDFTRLRIDNCLISSNDVEKCDFGFVRHFNEDFYFVELKGSNIEKAFKQIVSTIDYLNTNLILIPKNKRLGFIVSSKVPSGGTDINKLKQNFAKNYGKVLEIKNKCLIYRPEPS